jgi:formylglycine-generating enzyme required for sulfatase activity
MDHLKKGNVTMKTLVLTMISASALMCSGALFAAQLTVPNTFSKGATISSSQMNANFTAVQNAVNDNNTRITAAQTTANQASNPTCPSDSKPVGHWCIDTYEASAWDAATGGAQIPDLGTTGCEANGEQCAGIFARSVAGVLPLVNVSYLQAAQLCAAAGKQLVPQSLWQAGAAGTPPAPGACNTDTNARRPTGQAGSIADQANSCISNYGLEDMVGNVQEFIAEIETGTSTGNVTSAGVATTALHGGAAAIGNNGTIFRIFVNFGLTQQDQLTGFRCGRPL